MQRNWNLNNVESVEFVMKLNLENSNDFFFFFIDLYRSIIVHFSEYSILHIICRLNGGNQVYFDA